MLRGGRGELPGGPDRAARWSGGRARLGRIFPLDWADRMNVKKVLMVVGSLAAVAALVLGVVSTDARDVNPLGAIAVAVAAFAVLKASEYW